MSVIVNARSAPHRRQQQVPVIQDPVEHDQVAQLHDPVDEGLFLFLLVLEQERAEHRRQRHGQEQRAADGEGVGIGHRPEQALLPARSSRTAG